MASETAAVSGAGALWLRGVGSRGSGPRFFLDSGMPAVACETSPRDLSSCCDGGLTTLARQALAVSRETRALGTSELVQRALNAA